MKIFFKLISRERKEFLALVASGVFISATEAFFHPILLKLIFDESVIKKDFNKFLNLTLAYLIFGLVLNILSYCRSLWFKSFENKELLRLSSRLLEKFYRLDYRRISTNGSGYYISRVFTDVNEGFVPMMYLLDRLVSKFVGVMVFIGVMIYLSWKATLLLFLVSPFLIYLSHKVSKKVQDVTRKEREHQGIFLSSLEGSIRAFKIIRSLNLKDITLNNYAKKLTSYLNYVYKNFRLSRTYDTLSSITMNIADFLSLFVGAYYVIKGELTFGGYLAFVNTFWRTLTGVNNLFYEIPRVSKFREILKRLWNFLAEEPRMYFKPSKDIEVRKLNFAYNGKHVFKGLNIRIKSGERVCITGKNGSGKTTLAHILSGYLKPDSGEIKIPLKIASLTLPLHFPPITIMDMRIKDEVKAELGLLELGEKTPEELSEGQRQKLGIALALSFDAELYIFDEPLANIDERSRDKVFKLILEYTEGKTLLIIMHGFEMFHRYFNRVLNLDELKKARR